MHKIREIREYPPIHVYFQMERGKGHRFFWILLWKIGWDATPSSGVCHIRSWYRTEIAFWVNDEKQKMTFENYLRTYLKEHPDSNESDLPIVSGAMGYISYDYGREKENVAARHPKEVDMPDVILCFYDNFIIEDHQEKSFLILWQTVRPKRWIRCLMMWKITVAENVYSVEKRSDSGNKG